MLAARTTSSSSSGSSRTALSTSVSTSWTCFAASSTRRPQAFGVTPFEVRCSSARPHSSSSARICAVTAGCERCRSFAAVEIFPVWATTRKVSSFRGSIAPTGWTIRSPEPRVASHQLR